MPVDCSFVCADEQSFPPVARDSRSQFGEWESELEKLLRRPVKATQDVAEAAKSAPWKVMIARELRRTTTATKPWIAKQLAMGHPSRIPNLLKDI